jgi:mannose-6-phosphate isomerase-like protein (cupin superfamily)
LETKRAILRVAMRGQTHAFAVAVALTAAGACKSKEGPSAPGKIEADLPSFQNVGLTAKVSCGQACRLTIPEGASLSETSPLAIWEQDAVDGAHVELSRNRALDVLGVTLDGRVTLMGDAHEKAFEVPEKSAFLAPGAGVTLVTATGGRPRARVLLIAVTSGEPIMSVIDRRPEPWTERPAPIAVVDLSTQPDLAWGKGAYHARIGFEQDASPHASLTVLRMSGDAPVAAHLHEKEWEHMAILQGDGSLVQTIDEQSHGQHLEGGSFVSIPPRARHEWLPRGQRPFLGIQIYTPAGPEQRFKKLAAP